MLEHVANKPNKFSPKNDASSHQKSLVAAMAKLGKDIANDSWLHASYGKTDLNMMPAMVDLANQSNPDLNLKFAKNPNDFAAFIKTSLLEGQSARFIVNMHKDGLHFSIVDCKRTDGKTSAIMFESINDHGAAPDELANSIISAIDREHVADCHFSVILTDIQRNNAECGFFSLALANKLYSELVGLDDLHLENICREPADKDFFMHPENVVGEYVVEDDLTPEEQFQKFLEADEQEFAKFQAFRNSTRPQGEFVFTETPKYPWLEPAIHLTNAMMPGMLPPQQQTLTDTTRANTRVSFHNSASNPFPTTTSASTAKDPLLPLTIPLTAAALATTAASRGGYYAGATLGTAAMGLLTWLGAKHFTGSSSAATSPSQQVESTTTAATDDVDVEDVTDIYETNSLRFQEEPRTIDNNAVENKRDVGESAVRSRRSASDTENNQYIPAFMQTIIERKGLSNDVITNSILDNIRSDSTVMGLKGREREKVFLIKTLQYLSVLTKRYSPSVVKNYQPFIDALGSHVRNNYSSVTDRKEIASYIPEDLEINEENTESAISNADALDDEKRMNDAVDFVFQLRKVWETPILDMDKFITDEVNNAIRAYLAGQGLPRHYDSNDRGKTQQKIESLNEERRVAAAGRATQNNMQADSVVPLRITDYSVNKNTFENKAVKENDLRPNLSVKELVLGEAERLQKQRGSGNGYGSRIEDMDPETTRMVKWIREEWNIEQKMKEAAQALANNTTKVNILAKHTNSMITLRCREYLSNPELNRDSEYKRAVESFIAGETNAEEVSYNGVKLNDAFMIPVKNTKKGVLFSIHDSKSFEVGEVSKHYVDPTNKKHRSMESKRVSTFPGNNDFKQWVRDRIPLYHRPSDIQTDSIMEIRRSQTSRYSFSNFESHPFSFSPSDNQEDMAKKLVNGLLERLVSDADAIIRTPLESKRERTLEAFKTSVMVTSIGLVPVSMAFTGPLAAAAATGTMLTLDAAYVLAALELEKNADTASEANAHLNDAIIAAVLAGLGHTTSGVTMAKPALSKLPGLYQRVKSSLRSGSSTLIGQFGWRKLADSGKVSLMTDILNKTPAARQLVQRGVSEAINDQIRVAILARKELPFSVAQEQIQRLLERELRELEQADSVLEKYLDSPLLLPRDHAKHPHFAGHWVFRGQDINSSAVKRIVRDFSSDKYRDVFNMDTINTIHHEITWGGDYVVRDLGASGSSLKRAGFTKALNKIRSLDTHFQGEALYAAVMHYKPFATNNKAMARIMYLLGELRPQQELRHGAHLVAPLSEDAEAILSRKFSLPGEHAISQQEKEQILNDLTRLTNYHHPESEREFKIPGSDSVLLGKRENKVFSISRDYGVTWQVSNDKTLLTAWSLQNAGGGGGLKAKVREFINKMKRGSVSDSGAESSSASGGSGEGGGTPKSRRLMLQELNSDPVTNRVLWHDDWEGRIVDRDAVELKTKFDKMVNDMGGAESFRALTGIDPESINSPVCGVSAQNIFKLMVEDSVPINPVTLPKFNGISYQDLLAKLQPDKSYVAIVNDSRIGHKYLIDFPVIREAEINRDAYVIQSDAGRGVMPQLDINTWLTGRAGHIVNHEDLTKLYTNGFTELPQDTQRRVLSSVFDISREPSHVRLDKLNLNKRWDFSLHEYTPKQYQSNLDKLNLQRPGVSTLTSEQWVSLNNQGKIDFLVASLRNTDDAKELVRLSGSDKAVEQSIKLGRPSLPASGRIHAWRSLTEELTRAQKNLKLNSDIFKIPSRPIIEDSPAAALPEEMRGYLSEMYGITDINDRILKPKGQCSAVMESVVNFMKRKGMTDIRYRGMYVWSALKDEEAFNHFVVLGSKDGKQYVFDLTAGQFEDEGMLLLNGPKILSETDWAQLYQKAGGRRKLIVYKDFDSESAANRMFGQTATSIFEALENGMSDVTVLKEPVWYRRHLSEAFS